MHEDKSSSRQKGEILIELPMFNDTYFYGSTLMEESADGSTSVYVVIHKKLGTKRVLKAIKKSSDSSHHYLTEAKILASLAHPGIPTLYDYGEDEKTICLIEELVTGMSLKEYFLSHALKIDEIIRIIEKTADILIFLHERKPPVLYQDLKPEHIIINGDDIRLIDYGIARTLTLSASQNHKQNFGTPYYASPEARNGEAVDERTDVYSLGMLLKAMLSHTRDKIPHALYSLVSRATSESKDDRLPTVRSFKELLNDLDGSKTRQNNSMRFSKQNRNEDGLHKTIAVVGTEHAAGTTHIAISLVSYLNKEGFDACYVNASGSDVTRHLLENESRFKCKSTYIYHNHFKGVRELGNCVVKENITSKIQVLDCGTDYRKADSAYSAIFVFSSCPWKESQIDKNAHIGTNSALMVNPESRTLGIKLSKFFKRPVFGFPKNDDAFVMTGKKELVFRKVLKEVM